MTDPTSMPLFPESADQHPLRGRVLDSLVDAGLEPSIDEDGDVALTVQDQMLFIRCLDTEPPMLRAFGQWVVDDASAGDELNRLRAANAVTAALNLVKVTVNADRLAVAVDLVIGDGLELSSLLVATLEALLGSVRTWYETAAQLLADGDSAGPE